VAPLPEIVNVNHGYFSPAPKSPNDSLNLKNIRSNVGLLTKKPTPSFSKMTGSPLNLG